MQQASLVNPLTFSILLSGSVQGMGLRPTVYRLAVANGILGCVKNSNEGVVLTIQGGAEDAKDFLNKLRTALPKDFEYQESIVFEGKCGNPFYDFKIIPSDADYHAAEIPSDKAICNACLKEIQDDSDRRFFHAFNHCTDCGPRFSIIKNMPFDRNNTSMSAFAMCQRCYNEYQDTNDRRLHGQTISCPQCGPELFLQTSDGELLKRLPYEVIDETCKYLKKGQIVAIKGIGGFHLACDISNVQAIQRLRERKHRPTKPFALMMRDLTQVREYFDLSDAEAQSLNSAEAPITLLAKSKLKISLNETIAPDVSHLGVMLAYSPLHFLIVSRFAGPLIMTSANKYGAPVEIENESCLKQLIGIADMFLFHNRNIERRCEDSLVKIIADVPHMVRRGRGYVPKPIRLPFNVESKKRALAVGGDLKNCFAFNKGNNVVVSAYNGDMANLDCYRETFKSINDHLALFNAVPNIIAVDRHPNYLSASLGRKLAIQKNVPVKAIQHHHAHMASCMVENAVTPDKKVLGIILDGLGYGIDETLWGCEFLLGDYKDCQRVAHLQPFPLLGNELANKQPWRNAIAISSLSNSTKETFTLLNKQPISNLSIEQTNYMLEARQQFSNSSSAGRLFDAVAAILGVAPNEQSYEGEAACKLEYLAMQSDYQRFNESDVPAIEIEQAHNVLQLSPRSIWNSLLQGVAEGKNSSNLAMLFHHWLIFAIAKVVIQLKSHSDLDFDAIALSGGVFQNEILASQLPKKLAAMGVPVFTHHDYPANDGGIALGQIAIALNQEE